MAQVLSKGPTEWPFMWQPGLVAKVHSQDLNYGNSQASEVYVADRSHVIRKPTTHKDRFPKSEIIKPTNDEHASKKRRMLGKQNPEFSLGSVQDVIKKINTVVPRVGKREVSETATNLAICSTIKRSSKLWPVV